MIGYVYVIDVKGIYCCFVWDVVGGFDVFYCCVYDMDFVFWVVCCYKVELVVEMFYYGWCYDGNFFGNVYFVVCECVWLFGEMVWNFVMWFYWVLFCDCCCGELFDEVYVMWKWNWFGVVVCFYWKVVWLWMFGVYMKF